MAEAHPKPPTPLPVPEPDENAVERRTLRDYYIMLRERLWIALPLALLLSIGYAYKSLQVTPTYAATAKIQFEKPEQVVMVQAVSDIAVRSEIDINTKTEELKSSELSDRVRQSFTPEEIKILQRAALKQLPAGSAQTNVGIPMGSVDVAPMRNTLLIRVTAYHEDPEAAALVANRYVEMFMQLQFEKASGSTGHGIVYLNTQAERAQAEMHEAEQKLQDYRKQHQLTSLDTSEEVVNDALKKAAASTDEARLRQQAFEERMKLIDLYKKEGRNLYEITEIANYGTVPALRGQLSALEQEMNMLSERYYERHYKMVDVTARIDVTERELLKATELAIADLNARHDDAKRAYENSTAELKKTEKEAQRLAELRVAYNTLLQQAQLKRSSYQDMIKRLEEMRTVKNIEKIPLRPLDKAMPNMRPVSPNRSAITRTSIGLGILIFVGVAIGLSFIDDRIKSAWDVESFIGANLLGIIPDLGSLKDEEKYAMLLENKQAPGVEAFLSVYSSIKIHSKLDFPKSILVTSTIPGEGKTLISCNVAGCFARHGKKTLLIDCDLRRPMLHRHFKQQNTAGLITWFEAGAMLEGDLSTHPSLGIVRISENLSLLCSGGRSKTPTELLENPVFGQLLERLKKEYDLVVVDSPPLGAVTDSLLIAERVDEVVYVCRFNRAYRKHIRLYMRTLRQGKNEVLGIVLNGLSPRRIEYYSSYRYYRSYKKYYGAQT